MRTRPHPPTHPTHTNTHTNTMLHLHISVGRVLRVLDWWLSTCPRATPHLAPNIVRVMCVLRVLEHLGLFAGDTQDIFRGSGREWRLCSQRNMACADVRNMQNMYLFEFIGDKTPE